MLRWSWLELSWRRHEHLDTHPCRPVARTSPVIGLTSNGQSLLLTQRWTMDSGHGGERPAAGRGTPRTVPPAHSAPDKGWTRDTVPLTDSSSCSSALDNGLGTLRRVPQQQDEAPQGGLSHQWLCHALSKSLHTFWDGLSTVFYSSVWFQVFGDRWLIFAKVVLVLVVAQSRPTLCGPVDSSPPGSSVSGILQDILENIFSKNTGVGNHSLLQGIFLSQGRNPGLLH